MLQMTSDSLPVMAESSFGPQLWIMNTINAGYICPSTFCDRVDLRVSHQYFENSRTDRQFNDTTRHQQEEQINSMAVSFNLVKHLKENHRLTYGMEVIYDQVRSSGTGENIVTGETVSGMGCYPRAGWGSYGLYLDYLLNVNEKINIEAGVRYNLYQLDADFDTSFISLPYSVAYVNNDALTGCIGVTWQPGKQWQLNLSFSTGFRSPNVDDIGRLSGSENGTVIVPNPSLESEYAYNAETGFSKIFGKLLKIDMTGYFTWLSRALVCRDFRFNRQDSIDYNGGLSKVQAVQNARRAMVYGLQAGMELRLPAGFGVISRFNWQQGTEELIDGSLSPMRHAAPWFGRAGLTYSSARLSGEFYAAFSGQASFDHLSPEELDRAYLYALDQEGNPYSPAWCTINLKASYRLNRILSLSCGLENITDKRYRPYSSGISSPGVNFILSLRAGF
jgi:hemoglobin/transferrin/lactoferrin receptor protein